ncbi:DUF3320 domain-containing protein [Actinomadura flavalba]|uniref:DUF3320 domain-containing protein n=1 Tax=Actinomadura flavalba TaxID=1120938 RepID=UPI00038099D4|nr:DUF3320 domain-containing protein [Actinomadura flavalba]
MPPSNSCGISGRPSLGGHAGIGARPAVQEHRVAIIEAESEPVRLWAYEYRLAVISPLYSRYEIHTLEALPQIQQILRQVIETEAPVSHDVLFRRAVEAWGGGKVGSRIRANLQIVLREVVDGTVITDDGRFVHRAGRPEAARYPSSDSPARKVADIAPVELGWALLGIVAESPGITAEQLLVETCRFFGWSRLGADIRTALDGRLRQLVHEKAGSRATLRRSPSPALTHGGTRADLRLSFRLIRGRSGASADVHRIASPHVSDGGRRRRTVGLRIGKRVGCKPSRVRISYPPPRLTRQNTAPGLHQEPGLIRLRSQLTPNALVSRT